MTVKKKILGLMGWLVLCYAAAALGGIFTPGEAYAELRKPDWNPPGWIFGPVWSVLYTMMAVAAWLVWKQCGFAAQRMTLGIFFVQLALNALWSPLFFGLQWMGIAFVEIVLMWFAILMTVVAFRKVSRPAAWLLMPYLLWVGFASVLNGTLWWMNRG
ncbi:MAG: tryptophan-rich sensory protein [Akkermansiaceae bacterium]|nr:tryptophan-rich sensory protein [Akkermansiaceae bacterium]MDP4645951.1 tryptophan-rich sensory protein [Akkermansiaceae bacterium]MDP4722425.1 tryptophan-rich sensory protein [Akkermansiaceae bacterium]MDP4898475.1 tryptophan-rich sensory protein [Akkermansiaceae bacterium]MDP4995172.1 tryptophan-rich sensory protein [Akkermansiaceae bacterium]